MTRSLSLAGSCWELTRDLDGHDRVMLVLSDDGREALAVYLLHTDPEWHMHVFPYPTENLLKRDLWRRVA